jgi:hypothetical protein
MSTLPILETIDFVKNFGAGVTAKDKVTNFIEVCRKKCNTFKTQTEPIFKKLLEIFSQQQQQPSCC